MKKCSECVCYGACAILLKFMNSFSEEKNELSPCGNFRPYDPREQITAKRETDGKFPRCSHCGEHSFQREKHCPNCGARMEGVPADDVATVRYGHWVDDGIVICSECGKRSVEDFETPYCQWCGAKMDGNDGEHENEGKQV